MPLLMLHGVLGEAAHWQPLFAHLPRGLRALALELPFFSHQPALTSVALVAAYVRAFIAAAGIKRLLLAGNSIGGHAALMVAAALPAQVHGVVLTGSGGLVERRFGTLPGTEPPLPWVRERISEVFHNQAVVTDELVERVYRVITNRACGRQLITLFRSVRNENAAPLLPAIACPVLLLWGRHDAVTPAEAALRFHALLPDSELYWCGGSGHAPMLEEPELFAQYLGDWWTQRFARRAA